MALDFPVGTDFPANGNQIPDGHEYDGFYWDATEGVWKRICEGDRIGDCLEDDETVCDRLVSVENGIIELEEEFENLLPSLDRGAWRYNEDFTKPPGKFGLRTAEGGLPTAWNQVAKLIIHNTDDAGEAHGFSDIAADSYIQLFQDGESDTAIYQVVTAPVANGDEFEIEVGFVREAGDSYPALEELFRFKFYEIVGGDAGAYVLKTGDQMTGELEFYKEQADDSTDYSIPAVNTKDIRFSTKDTDGGLTQRIHLYQPGYIGTVVCSGNLMARNNLYTGSYIYGATFNSDGTKVTKWPRILLHRSVNSSTGEVSAEYGALRWGGNDRVYWDGDEVQIKRTPLVLDGSLATEDNHAIHKGYIDLMMQASGLQLGNFQYRRSSDSFVSGSIKSNTSTNPANITQIDMYRINKNQVYFTVEFYMAMIKNKMYFHFRDKNTANYTGRITAVTQISNGVRLTLTPIADLITGSVYYLSEYDVFIGYNKYGHKLG